MKYKDFKNSYEVQIGVRNEGENYLCVLRALYNPSAPLQLQVAKVGGLMSSYQIKLVYEYLDESKLNQLRKKIYECPGIIHISMSRL